MSYYKVTSHLIAPKFQKLGFNGFYANLCVATFASVIRSQPSVPPSKALYIVVLVVCSMDVDIVKYFIMWAKFHWAKFTDFYWRCKRHSHMQCICQCSDSEVQRDHICTNNTNDNKKKTIFCVCTFRCFASLCEKQCPFNSLQKTLWNHAHA